MSALVLYRVVTTFTDKWGFTNTYTDAWFDTPSAADSHRFSCERRFPRATVTLKPVAIFSRRFPLGRWTP